mgnify:CR=1 FL=1
MRKDLSIKRNYQFRYIFKNAKPIRKYYTTTYIVKNRYNKNRLGITLSKDIKGAVNRNRAKRLIRESMNLLNKQIKHGYDIVINLNIFSKRLKSTEIYNELKNVFISMDLIDEKNIN